MNETIKVLNLYAGIGGNRKLWENVEVTAVEIDKNIAKIYKEYFPDDKVIVKDAHKYLLKHYEEFEFIWSSPPCPTHSRTNTFLNAQGIKRFPDMDLYQEIIFLRQWCRPKWVVENVISYYEPMIKPYLCGRHYFWSNFIISKRNFPTDIGTFNREASEIAQKRIADITGLTKRYGFDIRKYKIKDKRKVLRNVVNPELGLHVFKCAFKDQQMRLAK